MALISTLRDIAPHRPHGAHGASAARTVLAVGPLTALLALALTAASAAVPAAPETPRWLVVVALVALVLGVPHGAVDHLALSRRPTGTARLLAAVLYIGAAAVAAVLVLAFPVPAFLAVLALSVWHFGTGDVQALDELSRLGGRPAPSMGPATRWAQVLAAGAVPVLLPLTSAHAAATLQALEPGLTALVDQRAAVLTRAVVLVLAAVVCVRLAVLRRHRAYAELLLLVALGLMVEPLLAFAVYFAGWHAVRHTARLALGADGDLDPARLREVLLAGLPALVVSAIVVAVAVGRSDDLGGVLWLGLAVVWGLTVPHMAVVGAFDRRRRRATPGQPTSASTSDAWSQVSQS